MEQQIRQNTDGSVLFSGVMQDKEQQCLQDINSLAAALAGGTSDMNYDHFSLFSN